MPPNQLPKAPIKENKVGLSSMCIESKILRNTEREEKKRKKTKHEKVFISFLVLVPASARIDAMENLQVAGSLVLQYGKYIK